MSGVVDAIAPSVPGVPFGFILGLAIANAPIDGIIGWIGSWFILGGAAQLTMTSLLTDGAGPTAAVIAALIVNARHVMYSMAMASRFQDQPRWFRWIGPHQLIDQVFALSDIRRDVSPTSFRHYYIGSAITMVFPWVVSVALGISLGARIPVEWNLEFAVPVLFTGLLMLGMKNAGAALAAVVAFAVTVGLSTLPSRTGLLIGAVAGVVAATLVPTADHEPAP